MAKDDRKTIKDEEPKIDWTPPVHNAASAHGRTIYVLPQAKPETKKKEA
jgi:hypothetical protein